MQASYIWNVQNQKEEKSSISYLQETDDSVGIFLNFFLFFFLWLLPLYVSTSPTYAHTVHIIFIPAVFT